MRLTELLELPEAELLDICDKFRPLMQHFNRYLMVGGFPELVLSGDDAYAQKMLLEDVVDKVIKRDVLSLFNVRNPLLMEKLFLYLCLNSTQIFSVTTAAKELENISVSTLENYMEALIMSNLVDLARPMNVGSKGALKGRPKVFIADAAIRNAVLIIEEYGRRFFLLYLRPIINGTGNFYIEAQTRDKRRTDVIVDYHGKQFIIEMKIWHGREYHERGGEDQLADYLDAYHKQLGYMLSFNFNKGKETGVFERIVGDKRIVEAVV